MKPKRFPINPTIFGRFRATPLEYFSSIYFLSRKETFYTTTHNIRRTEKTPETTTLDFDHADLALEVGAPVGTTMGAAMGAAVVALQTPTVLLTESAHSSSGSRNRNRES